MNIDDAIYDYLKYLPIEDITINDYLNSLVPSIKFNYNEGHFHLAYFSLHLVFMTYIYNIIWKISYLFKDKYSYSTLFARPYNNKDINFANINTVFDFSKMPEKDVMNFLSIIGLENTYIKPLQKLIDRRNDMAHASGIVSINTKESFDIAFQEILDYTMIIHKQMQKPIKDWYTNILIEHAVNTGYDLIEETIQTVMIEDFSLSYKEMATCSEIGMRKFKEREPFHLSAEEIDVVLTFHECLKKAYFDIQGDEDIIKQDDIEG